MTDYKQLCKDLAEDLGFWMEYGHSPANLPFEEDCTYKLLKRARAALAEPESEEPTDEEIGDWHDECADLTRMGETSHYWAFGDVQEKDVIAIVRAAFQRWGHHTRGCN